MGSKLKGTSFHNHTDFSLLDGMQSCEQVCKRAKELGYDYVCISDHGNVAGHVEMYNRAKEAHLTPVLGTELYVKDDRYDNGKPKGYHLCVWALNEEGLHNVWAISSNTYYRTSREHRTPNTYWEDMEGHGKGVACTSACLASALGQAAKEDNEEMALYFTERYASIFDEFYIELHSNSMQEQRKVNLWLLNFAKKHGYKVLYAVDAHYSRPEDADVHDMWLGCQTKAFYDEPHWKMDHEYYMQSEAEIAQRLSYLGDDLQMVFDGMDDFLSKVEKYEIDTSRKVPVFPLPEGWTDNVAYLKYLLVRNLIEKVGGVEVMPRKDGDAPNHIRYKGEPNIEAMRPYKEQLELVELPVIVDNGLTDYFLIVQEYIHWAKSNNYLMGPARGSCAASVLCWLLGITEVDPMGKGLYFSRFLNAGRVKGGLPDIDSDIGAEGRVALSEHLKDVYGEDKVTAVGVVTFFGIKLALKEVCRYYKIPITDSNRITKLAEQLEEMGGSDWQNYIPSLLPEDSKFLNEYRAKFPDLFDRADKIVGLARQYGKHAAGYVVSPVPLAGILPVRKSDDDEIITQFDKVAVEKLGFLKADLLGLRNLDTLELTRKLIQERHGVWIDYYSLKEEPPTSSLWSLFENGETLGLFQLEGDAITGLTKQLKPKSIQDLSTILALYRPGIINARMPDGSGMLDNYVKRAQGLQPVQYLAPQLEPILKDTYGTIVYQEQIIAIVMQLGGFTEVEADGVRAAISKQHMDKLQAARPKFVKGCLERGITSEQANAIFNQMEASGNYIFNKAHSLGYGTVTYWTAWVKHYYPIEYYAACMSTVGTDKAPLYMREAKRKGFRIVPPSMSKLSEGYSILNDTDIAFGLVNVKGVGGKTIDKILAGAPYADFNDFVQRSGANSAAMSALIKGGVFREYEQNRRKLLARYERGVMQEGLFDIDEDVSDYDDEGIEAIETEIYGMPLSIDGFAKYRDMLGSIYAAMETLPQMENSPNGSTHLALVKVAEVRPKVGKKGVYAFLRFTTDRDEEFEAVIFADTYSITQQWLKESAYLVVEIAKECYNNKASYTVRRVQSFKEGR